DEAAINPEAATEELPHMTMWSTLLKSDHKSQDAFESSKSLRKPTALNPLRPYQPLEPEVRSPAEGRVVYHPPNNSSKWGWKVSAYLGTKSLGAGAMIVAALALALYGLSGNISGSMNMLLGIGAPVIGGFFIAVTLVLL